MPYLPPHLRDGGGSDSGSDRGSDRGADRAYDSRSGGGRGYDGSRGGGYDRGGYDDRRGGGDRYDDRRGGGGDRYDDRRGGGGGGGGSGGKYPPAIFADWKPSARVQALSVNQVRRTSSLPPPLGRELRREPRGRGRGTPEEFDAGLGEASTCHRGVPGAPSRRRARRLRTSQPFFSAPNWAGATSTAATESWREKTRHEIHTVADEFASFRLAVARHPPFLTRRWRRSAVAWT